MVSCEKSPVSQTQLINGRTRVYGIIGNPVRHSRSPLMHNAAFAVLHENAVYVPLPAVNIAEAIVGIRALGIQGISVTIPHKETILPYLDSIDLVAGKIGAVNTVTLIETVEGTELHGLNTDWIGANRALREKISLPGKRAVILGAGGSARAIGFGLIEAGVEIVFCSRTEQRGRALAEELNCPWHPLTKVARLAGDVLINATSVGMVPRSQDSLLGQQNLPAYRVVMDIVYAPVRTRLLREAEAVGCQVISGLEMLLHQGAAQFESWTGQKAPIATMRQALFAAENM